MPCHCDGVRHDRLPAGRRRLTMAPTSRRSVSEPPFPTRSSRSTGSSRRQGPARDRRCPCPRLLRRAPARPSTSTSTSSSQRPLAAGPRHPPARRRRQATSARSSETDRCGCGGGATPSTSSSPTTSSTRRCSEARRVPFGQTRSQILSPEHLAVCKAMFDRPRTGSTSSRSSSPRIRSTWPKSNGCWSGWSGARPRIEKLGEVKARLSLDDPRR